MSTALTSTLLRSSPIRQCGGCKARHPANKLIRFVSQGDKLVADLRRRHQGRGAHVCPSLRCVALLVKRRALKRGLKTSRGWPEAVVYDAIREGLASESARLRGHFRQHHIPVSASKRERIEWLSAAAVEFSCTLQGAGAINRERRQSAGCDATSPTMHALVMGTDE